jgi:hypothetical protein
MDGADGSWVLPGTSLETYCRVRFSFDRNLAGVSPFLSAVLMRRELSPRAVICRRDSGPR